MSPDEQNLRGLIDQLDVSDTDDRARIVMQMVQRGTAIWISPTTPGICGGPATHQHEITIYGIEATGPDGATALANWITVAKRCCNITAPRGTTTPRGAMKSRGVAA